MSKKYIRFVTSKGRIGLDKARINVLGMRIARNVPLVLDFEGPPVGYCDLFEENGSIICQVEMSEVFYKTVWLDKNSELWDLTPALGIIVHEKRPKPGYDYVVDFEVVDVSLNTDLNSEMEVLSMGAQLKCGDAKMIVV